MAYSELTKGSNHHNNRFMSKVGGYARTAAEIATVAKSIWEVGRMVQPIVTALI